ncbi:hypothetical protein OPU71_10245 [Niveibacterium sp. 24ML]|uniref:hypothetical protein n=1 Tax=Niveibacterium sp. 24ML TaxID=2985512 RepID=UPI00226FA902|nr:hypothetical protein [Niveibacterium sp. 24ML]MCX9156501.1 hypothetical protein [Niveibacterium sp. 24ML]
MKREDVELPPAEAAHAAAAEKGGKAVARYAQDDQLADGWAHRQDPHYVNGKSQLRGQIRALVSFGHCWHSRIAALPWGPALLTGFSIFLLAFALYASRAPRLFESHPAAAAESRNERSQVNSEVVRAIRWQPTTQVTRDDVAQHNVTLAGELPNFVKQQLDALSKTNKLSADIPCAELTAITSSWANPSTGKPDVPLCRSAGDTIYIASVVLNERQQLQPWLGAFHKADGWHYVNVQVPGLRTAEVSGFETIPAARIAPSLLSAFPEIGGVK